MNKEEKKFAGMVCGLALVAAPVAAMAGEQGSAEVATNRFQMTTPAPLVAKAAQGSTAGFLKDGTTLVYDFGNPVVNTSEGAFIIPEGFKVEVLHCTWQTKIPKEGVKILSAERFEGVENFNKNAIVGTKIKMRLALRQDGLYLYKVKGLLVRVLAK